MRNEQIIIKKLEDIKEGLNRKNKSTIKTSAVVFLLERLIYFIYDLEYITTIQKEHEEK